MPLFCALLLGLAASPLPAAFPTLQLKPVAVNQLSMPLVITNAGDGSGRMFLVDQRGHIRVFQDGAVLPQVFLDISSLVIAGGEAGLLGLCFHPDYETVGASGQGKFYVFYSGTPSSGSFHHRDVIAEYQVSAGNPNVANPASGRIVLTIDHPQSNHNGGCMNFSPADGLLYISTGDGGGGGDTGSGHTPNIGNALDRTNLLGKVLRIDPLGNNGPGGAYGIPASNPFVGNVNGYRTEIYAYGLRNPWRFSFDSGPAGGTNRLFLGDVGQEVFEEVDIITSGGNYGWRRYEGFADYDAGTPFTGTHSQPIYAYSHALHGVSVIGGYVYRGNGIPALQGKYVFGDYIGTSNGQMLGLEETSPGSGSFTQSVLNIIGGNPIGRRILCFGADEAGELYIGTATSISPTGGTGSLYKIVAAPDPVALNVTADRDNSIFSESTGYSNGAGGDLFAGQIQTGASLRRGLIHFDTSGIPAGSTALTASVGLFVNQIPPGATAGSFGLHRLTQNWGEAGSIGSGQGAPAQTGDATWANAFHPSTAWLTAGGQFQPTASATTTVPAATGAQTWSAAGLVSDVQVWINQPNNNFGWILRGPETSFSAKRFSSREAVTASERPVLSLSYRPPLTLTRREVWEQQYFTIGSYIAPTGDVDADAIPNLFEYAWDLHPSQRNSSASLFGATLVTGTGQYNVTFRRDPRAIDLTYILEGSSDLTNWSPWVTSAAGAAPAGAGFLSEGVDPNNSAVRLVQARDPMTYSVSVPRFVRLRIVR